MQEQLDEILNEGTVHEKYAAYNLANKKVAILCNHQRTVSTTHETMMQRQEEKVRLDFLIYFLIPDTNKVWNRSKDSDTRNFA